MARVVAGDRYYISGCREQYPSEQVPKAYEVSADKEDEDAARRTCHQGVDSERYKAA